MHVAPPHVVRSSGHSCVHVAAGCSGRVITLHILIASASPAWLWLLSLSHTEAGALPRFFFPRPPLPAPVVSRAAQCYRYVGRRGSGGDCAHISRGPAVSNHEPNQALLGSLS